MAKFFGTDGAILYAQGYSAVSSVIPAFSKRGDVIIADEMANDAIISGLKVSRSYVYYFKHNNMEDLERLLVEAQARHGAQKFSRRFIVTESLFQTTGNYADLTSIIEIKKKYKYRLIVDNSIGLGTAGRHCNGLDCDDTRDVDIIVGSLANSVGAAGGYCAGSTAVVDHQVSFFLYLYVRGFQVKHIASPRHFHLCWQLPPFKAYRLFQNLI